MPDRPPRSPEAYLLGSRDEELTRLAFQHRVWAEQAFGLWERAGFGFATTLLDLGCGPGFSSIDLAHLVGPRGRVIAVDGSARFLAHLEALARDAGLNNIEAVECDAHRLAVEPESLDGAYARWIFCFLSDPLAVVRQVAQALRPGAALAVTDYANYRAFTFAPRSERLDAAVRAVEACWRRDGGDLEIQSRMPGLMRECGLDVQDVRLITRVARPGTPLWNWPLTFFQNFMPTLVEAGLVSEDDSRAFFDEWEQRGDDPDTYLFLPPMVDVVGVKPVA